MDQSSPSSSGLSFGMNVERAQERGSVLNTSSSSPPRPSPRLFPQQQMQPNFSSPLRLKHLRDFSSFFNNEGKAAAKMTASSLLSPAASFVASPPTIMTKSILPKINTNNNNNNNNNGDGSPVSSSDAAFLAMSTAAGLTNSIEDSIRLRRYFRQFNANKLGKVKTIPSIASLSLNFHDRSKEPAIVRKVMSAAAASAMSAPQPCPSPPQAQITTPCSPPFASSSPSTALISSSNNSHQMGLGDQSPSSPGKVRRKLTMKLAGSKSPSKGSDGIAEDDNNNNDETDNNEQQQQQQQQQKSPLSDRSPIMASAPPSSDDMANITWPNSTTESKTRGQLYKRGSNDEISQWSNCVNQYCSRRGMDQDESYFVSTNSEVRRALNEMGMIEVKDPEFEMWSFRFVTSHRDVPYEHLQPCQVVNHYDQSAVELGSKAGLLRNVRSLCWLDKMDVSSFVPRTYNLKNTWELIKFVDDFIALEAQAILVENEKHQNPNDALVMFATQITNRLVEAMKIAGFSVPLGVSVGYDVTDLFILRPDLWVKYEMVGQSPQPPMVFPPVATHQIQKDAADVLQRLREIKKVDYDGDRNVWICKPGHSSRGRGIKLHNDLVQILRFAMNRKSSVIAQKYLETPLLVEDKKFDIRIWVLVTNWNPLTIWTFDPCYIRICTKNHNFDDLTELYAHLCNRCVQTKSGDYCGDEAEASGDTATSVHMWDSHKFREYLEKKYPDIPDVWEGKVWKSLKELIVRTLHSVQDVMDGFNRKNSFEWFGFDVMIDRNFGCWLIEVNISPDTACVTDVLKVVVPAAVSDLVNMFLSKDEDSSSAGKWVLLFKGKNIPAMTLRQRASYSKVKSSEMRSGCPFSTRESMMKKLGPSLYSYITRHADEK